MSSNANPGLVPPKLPALRLTADGECVLEEAVPLDMPSGGIGFGISYPSSSLPASSIAPATVATSTATQEWSQGQALSSRMEGQTTSLDISGGVGAPAISQLGGMPHPGLYSTRSEGPPPPVAKDAIPRFTRATTMPLPSQLNQLQHPYRTNTRRRSEFDTAGLEESTATTTPDEESSSSECPASGYDSPHVKELSYELADSIQMVVQTLLQISPAQVLDPTKEQFTACSLSVPTSSMSAMFTVMKNINYLSANIGSYFTQVPGGMSSRRLDKQPMRSSSAYPVDRIEFDIGDTLQAIGDSLSGCAAQVGVDLVLYHGDVSLKHVNVYGDEASLRYAITQVRVLDWLFHYLID